ncbi:class I SAM-dependent methyltransferase [Actinacidiphila acididurans]|uniref:Methyltransferase domain-containing protein n=1 Tax=Actinacidiphila acididurans TaxID=2784346 RepID=A0ABS2TXN1_9ACTN|nr:class I SAM-dependent methyltransferase [Actinacidiphila acididurans]MBM9508112.1 methyltransferase domain-containing protein [Actinacidiphila acididurans]
MTSERQAPAAASGHGGHGQGNHGGHGGHHHSHGHSHGGEDIDWAAMAAHLEREGELTLPELTGTARWLRGLTAGEGAGVRRVLDVGSGPGVAAGVFAQEFPGAQVVAVDGSAPLLERALERAAAAGLGPDRFTTVAADLPEDFGALGQADLIWSSRAVHHLGDQQDALNRLARALREGGLLAIAEDGLPLRFLPRDIGLGRPGLATRLDAVNAEWFTAMRAELPYAATVVEDWPELLRRAGLTPVGSRTFLTDLPAPLGPAARDQLHARLSRTREMMADDLAEDDLRTLDALLDDDSPHTIRSRPDAFFLTAYTVHAAVR